MSTPNDVSFLRLALPKANSMDAAFLDHLERALDELEAGPSCAAVVTGSGRSFSAGLALTTLVGQPREPLRAFMFRFAAVMERVFSFPKPIVAAVNGHAIAGGCVLALQCDWRVMVDQGARIGLSEAQLGIGLPACLLEPLRMAVPASSLLPIACEGRVVDPAEARALGLVDAIAPAADLERVAAERAAELGAIAPTAYAQLKRGVRRPTLAAMRADAEGEMERWLDTWYSPTGQERLAAAVAKLTR